MRDTSVNHPVEEVVGPTAAIKGILWIVMIRSHKYHSQCKISCHGVKVLQKLVQKMLCQYLLSVWSVFQSPMTKITQQAPGEHKCWAQVTSDRSVASPGHIGSLGERDPPDGDHWKLRRPCLPEEAR